MKYGQAAKRIGVIILSLVLVLGTFPVPTQAGGEEILIDMNSLTGPSSGMGWDYSDRTGYDGEKYLLTLDSGDGTRVFHIIGNGEKKSVRIRPGSEAYGSFDGTIILENVNIEVKSAALDFRDRSVAILKLIGDNSFKSTGQAGININSGQLTIEAYDGTHSSLTVIGGGEMANGIGTGEDWNGYGSTFEAKPQIWISGNCTVTAQGTKKGYALGARSLTMSGGATLNLANPSGSDDSPKGLDEKTEKSLSDCVISGDAAGNLPMDVAPATLEFGLPSTPYAQPAPQTVTITNFGEGSLQLEQPTSDSYTLGPLSQVSLGKGEKAAFTVQPKADLPEGNHEEEITINGTLSGTLSSSLFARVKAKFEVTALPPVISSLIPEDGAEDVSPSGAVAIRFNKAMNQNGTVSLDGGIGVLSGGQWSEGKTLFTIPYAGLDWATPYTLTITGFRDGEGNPAPDSISTFTTKAEPRGPEVDPDRLDILTGETKTFTVFLGQSGNDATQAVAASAASSVAMVSYSPHPIVVTTGSAVTVTGISEGRTTISVVFSGGSHNGGEGSTKTVEVRVTDPEPVSHRIIVEDDGYGTAFAVPAEAAARETVRLSYSADRGYRFREWQVIRGSVILSGNSFIMPDEEVVVKALFQSRDNDSGSDSEAGSGASVHDRPLSTARFRMMEDISIRYNVEKYTGLMTMRMLTVGLNTVLVAADESKTITEAPVVIRSWAEVPAILRRFAERIVNVKKGWMPTDKGLWQYIDGKWYYCQDDGKMAVSTVIDEYTVGEDGARMNK